MKLLIRKKEEKKSLDHLKAQNEIHQVPKKGLYDSNARGTNGIILSMSEVFKLPKLKKYNIRVQKRERDVVRKRKTLLI